MNSTSLIFKSGFLQPSTQDSPMLEFPPTTAQGSSGSSSTCNHSLRVTGRCWGELFFFGRCSYSTVQLLKQNPAPIPCCISRKAAHTKASASNQGYDSKASPSSCSRVLPPSLPLAVERGPTALRDAESLSLAACALSHSLPKRDNCGWSGKLSE